MRFWAPLLLCLPLAAQTPSFEVASIRPGNRTNTGSLCRNLQLSTESVQVSAVLPLYSVIADAYSDEADDFDLPPWTKSGNYAINIKVPPNTNVGACRQMLRNLLAERFP